MFTGTRLSIYMKIILGVKFQNGDCLYIEECLFPPRKRLTNECVLRLLCIFHCDFTKNDNRESRSIQSVAYCRFGAAVSRPACPSTFCVLRICVCVYLCMYVCMRARTSISIRCINGRTCAIFYFAKKILFKLISS